MFSPLVGDEVAFDGGCAGDVAFSGPEDHLLIPFVGAARFGRSIMLNLARIRSVRRPHCDETQADMQGAEPLHLGRLAGQRLRKVVQELGDGKIE